MTAEFTGALATFLEEMRLQGKSEMRYRPDPALREECSLKASYVFNSHRELDEFVRDLIIKKPTFKLDYRTEYLLLKSFDRAFWCRYFQNSSLDEYAAHGPPDKFGLYSGCAFGDPRITGSIVMK